MSLFRKQPFNFFCLALNPSDISVLCHSSEIEQSSDDVHDELVEDDDEEVMLEMQCTKYSFVVLFPGSLLISLYSEAVQCHTFRNWFCLILFSVFKHSYFDFLKGWTIVNWGMKLAQVTED